MYAPGNINTKFNRQVTEILNIPVASFMTSGNTDNKIYPRVFGYQAILFDASFCVN